MQEITVRVSISFTTLPAEVVTAILVDLHKADLKSVRMVCHYFEEVATPLLYDKVIISHQEPNFAPFDNITSTPRFSKHVKTLSYDISWFDDIPMEYYLTQLLIQLNQHFAIHETGLASSALPSHLRETLKDVGYFRDATTTRGREVNLLPWREHIETGFQQYRSHCNTQGSTSNRERIASALNNCPNLQLFQVCASWENHSQSVGDGIDSLLPRYYSSGYLARHWHPFYLRPENYDRITYRHSFVVEDVFDIIHESGKQISLLSIGDGCTIGPDMHVVPTSMHMDMPFVFGHLTELSLDVGFKSSSKPFYFVEHLSPALRAARNLKHFTLRGRNTSTWRRADDHRWNFSVSFPHFDLVLPRLVSLHLSGMQGFASHYLNFLWKQPLLQSLHLDSIDIIQTQDPVHEDWIHFIEGLRQLQSLDDFSLEWPLRTTRDGVRWSYRNFLDREGEAHWPTIKGWLEQYVLHQGTSPFSHKETGEIVLFGRRRRRPRFRRPRFLWLQLGTAL